MIYEGYLTELKLKNIFKKYISPINWLGAEVTLPSSKRRFDFGFINDGIKTLVEFDGAQHYTDALQIKIDREKDLLALRNNYKLIRIPYWVQLTSETLNYYFSIKHDVFQSYPHGFIDDKAILPASFCELGVYRFYDEYTKLPKSIQLSIWESLAFKINSLGTEYTIPSFLNGKLY